jgi:hypothetical protein
MISFLSKREKKGKKRQTHERKMLSDGDSNGSSTDAIQGASSMASKLSGEISMDPLL